jgi:NHS family xanthosine MFS transporter
MIAGAVVDHFTVDGIRDWHSIWLAFAGHALALGIVFPFVFRTNTVGEDGTATTAQRRRH